MKNISKILDDSFYKSVRGKKFIYKLYFNGYEENCYIGYENNKKTNIFLNDQINELWSSFLGLAFNENNFNNIYCKIEKMKKKTEIEKNRLFELARANRIRMVEGMYKNIFNKKQIKYIKMFYFMDLNHLHLKDLRIKIINFKKNTNDDKLIDMYYNELISLKCFYKGFNSFSIINQVFFNYKNRKKISIPFFDAFENILNSKINVSNAFEAWNMFWNIFQLFNFTIENNILYWLIHWKFISFQILEEQNKNIIDYIKENYLENKKITYKHILIRQLSMICQTLSKLNYQEKFNNSFFIFTNEFILKNITFNNKKYSYKTIEFEIEKNIDFNVFKKNNINWIKMKYENWKKQYYNLIEYFSDFKYFEKIFKSNPFANTMYIYDIIKDIKKYITYTHIYLDKNYIKNNINKIIDLIYFQKSWPQKKFDLINLLFLKDIHNIIIFLLIFIANEKYNDTLIINNIF